MSDAFNGVRFHGCFRNYQSKVLENADKYLKDGKINIVAAPGSGKTVLGLELIRRLNEPCIILSPTTAVRNQWCERFRSMFLDSDEKYYEMFSCNLHEIRILNSVTYQALQSAVDKTANADAESDCSDIDIFAVLKKHGIKTVCLDEAHHLKNEWQRALETFVARLDGDVKIISLTATPPYDSEPSEWNRYIGVCGEIDEEIFVPELVAQKNLCPHQDYIYFNFPSDAELKIFGVQKENASAAVEEIGKLEALVKLCRDLGVSREYDVLFASAKEYIALLVLFAKYGYSVSPKLVRQLTAKQHLPAFNMRYAETAVRFLLCGDLIDDECKADITGILKKHQVYAGGRAALDLNEKLKRMLISSAGKLESIRHITDSEFASMGSRLRMLILTDYINKENVSKISSGCTFSSVNIVSIFETIRINNAKIRLGAVSGSLVILPDSVALRDIKHKKQSIKGTGYAVFDFGCENHAVVEIAGKLLESGDIHVLIGTKSLLGEGWDSPCINSLILASFVGSFVQSNQMRGRAVRTDKNNPDKTANIWHLVTVEPDYLLKDKLSDRARAYLYRDNDVIGSYDFDILKRRFDWFMGPDYSTGRIESGIERISAVKPPFDRAGIERINGEMLKRSSCRADMSRQWKSEVESRNFGVSVETEIPAGKRVPVFTLWNFALYSIILLVQTIIINVLVNSAGRVFMGALTGFELPVILSSVIVFALLSYVMYRGIKKMILHFNPARSVKTLGTAVYETLAECGLISYSAHVETNSGRDLGYVSVSLRNASVHDQNLFNTAIKELLSVIENPRYILIAANLFGCLNYSLSFACPGVIGRKKEYVAVLTEKLKARTGGFKAVYTHREGGRKIILKCRKRSYITYNTKIMQRKFKVSHWE